MRLIDAENFSKSRKDYFTDMIINRKYNVDCVDCNADLQRLLDDQPTAYDVGKVVAKIKELDNPYDADGWFTSMKLDKAIEIVKAGVKNE